MNERCACMWHRYSIFTLNSQPQQLLSKKLETTNSVYHNCRRLAVRLQFPFQFNGPRLDVEMEVSTIWRERGADTLMEVFPSVKWMNESIEHSRDSASVNLKALESLIVSLDSPGLGRVWLWTLSWTWLAMEEAAAAAAVGRFWLWIDYLLHGG